MLTPAAVPVTPLQLAFQAPCDVTIKHTLRHREVFKALCGRDAPACRRALLGNGALVQASCRTCACACACGTFLRLYVSWFSFTVTQHTAYVGFDESISYGGGKMDAAAH